MYTIYIKLNWKIFDRYKSKLTECSMYTNCHRSDTLQTETAKFRSLKQHKSQIPFRNQISSLNVQLVE